MNVLIAGGTGFLGRALIKKLLNANHTIVLLSRPGNQPDVTLPSQVHLERWDAKNAGGWLQRVNEADAVVNLTGESIGGKRWTNQQKELIMSSRIDSTRAIVDSIRRADKKPDVFVSQSAVGYYGNVPEGDVTERQSPGKDFLAQVCRRWEDEACKAESLGVRVVLPRTGVVLDKHGGALPRFFLPFHLFIGGPLGSGGQWFPWIHLADEIDALIFALKNKSLYGPVNLAAPEHATMRQFCAALGKAMHRPSWASVPGFVLRVLLGEMAGPLLLGGQKVVPKKLIEAGFQFRFPTVAAALQDILR